MAAKVKTDVFGLPMRSGGKGLGKNKNRPYFDIIPGGKFRKAGRQIR